MEWVVVDSERFRAAAVRGAAMTLCCTSRSMPITVLDQHGLLGQCHVSTFGHNHAVGVEIVLRVEGLVSS